MRLHNVALALFVTLPVHAPQPTHAQSESCPKCVMGVFDDEDLSRNFGFWDPETEPVKSVWVGITYSASEFSSMRSVEFSVDGVAAFGCSPDSKCFGFDGLVEPNVTIGNTIASPDDKEAGVGGVSIAWAGCLTGNRAFVKLQLASSEPVPNDVVIRVMKRFPHTNPELPYPWYSTCDLIFAPVTVTGGCYVLNPTVAPGESVGDPPCQLATPTAVASDTWSTIKRLYR